jgi:ribosomal protein L29
MKSKQIKELKQKNKEELIKEAHKLAEELVKFKMEKQAGRLKNIQLIKKKKHELAIVKTTLREKEMNQ